MSRPPQPRRYGYQQRLHPARIASIDNTDLAATIASHAIRHLGATASDCDDALELSTLTITFQPDDADINLGGTIVRAEVHGTEKFTP